jgi:hypothetical protein
MLLDFFSQVKDWVKENEKAKIDERSRALEKALDDAANAKTKEEFIDAQKRVAANQP